MVTPIVVEVSDSLIPLVDSRDDGGRFLYTLIPAMRDRINVSTGLSVPGVRARGNPSLRSDQFVIQINEVTKARGLTSVSGHFTARAVEDGPSRERDDVAESHPLTGSPGRWVIEHHDEDPPSREATGPAEPDPSAPVTPAEYLSHRIQRVIRANLHHLLGAQEVSTLLDTWREEDADTVTAVIREPIDDERLTVLLQRLVAERVPVTDSACGPVRHRRPRRDRDSISGSCTELSDDGYGIPSRGCDRVHCSSRSPTPIRPRPSTRPRAVRKPRISEPRRTGWSSTAGCVERSRRTGPSCRC